MYKPHPAASEPEENVIIWRYMEFGKFKNILETGCLFFSSIDNLKDLNEGRCSVELTPLFEQIRKRTYVSCWTVRNSESNVMWDSYAKGPQGIAIKSSIARLRNCLMDSKIDQYIGNVNYGVSDSQPERNTLEPYLFKTEHYEDEKEIRSIVQIINPKAPLLWENNIEEGVLIEINLNELIENVYTSPNSSDDFITKVKETLSEFNLQKSVYASEILYRPDSSPIIIEPERIQSMKKVESKDQSKNYRDGLYKKEVNDTGLLVQIMENSQNEKDASGNIYVHYAEINQKIEPIFNVRDQKEYEN